MEHIHSSNDMPGKYSHNPGHVPQVMVSSTFKDLEELRKIVFDEINRYDMRADGMEHDGARLVDSLKSSLEMVGTCAGYVCVIGQRYGGVPECPIQNADNLSITELEFNAAQARGLPILPAVSEFVTSKQRFNTLQGRGAGPGEGSP